MKRIIIPFLLAVMALVTGFAEVPDEAWVMCQPNSELVVRAFPNKHAQEVARVFPADHLVLTGKKRGRWYQISLICEAGEGWVRKDFLSFTEPEVFPGGKVFTTTVRKLKARFSIKGNVRRKLREKGTEVLVFLRTDDWSVTSEGYIQTRFLEEKDGS